MSNATTLLLPAGLSELRAAVRGFTIHLSVWLCAMALVAAVDSKVRRAVLLGAATVLRGGSRASTIERLDASMTRGVPARAHLVAMLALGELLFLLGITPFGLITSVNIRRRRAEHDLGTSPPGLLAMMTSVVPTDRLVIRGLCIFAVIFGVEVSSRNSRVEPLLREGSTADLRRLLRRWRWCCRAGGRRARPHAPLPRRLAARRAAAAVDGRPLRLRAHRRRHAVPRDRERDRPAGIPAGR